MNIRLSVIALAACLLSACAGQPLKYYTLLPPPAAAAPATGPVLWVDLLPVAVPAQVDAPQLVVRHGNGELTLLERDQWAAPLDAEIRDALAAELSRRAGVRDAHTLTVPKGQTPLRLKLDVQRFDSVPGGAVYWEAAWSLSGSGESAPALACAFSAREAVGTGYAALVEGHQRVLQRLATQIAAALAALPAGAATPGCP